MSQTLPVAGGDRTNVFLISMFNRAFFNSIHDKQQYMYFFTFNTVLV